MSPLRTPISAPSHSPPAGLLSLGALSRLGIAAVLTAILALATWWAMAA